MRVAGALSTRVSNDSLSAVMAKGDWASASSAARYSILASAVDTSDVPFRKPLGKLPSFPGRDAAPYGSGPFCLLPAQVEIDTRPLELQTARVSGGSQQRQHNSPPLAIHIPVKRLVGPGL
ncbi:hypothetical protein HDU67_004968, partial [Dinochytrium kinnereticum]